MFSEGDNIHKQAYKIRSCISISENVQTVSEKNEKCGRSNVKRGGFAVKSITIITTIDRDIVSSLRRVEWNRCAAVTENFPQKRFEWVVENRFVHGIIDKLEQIFRAKSHFQIAVQLSGGATPSESGRIL